MPMQVKLGSLSLRFSGYTAVNNNVPDFGERVRVAGERGWFIVADVDEETYECALVSADWPGDHLTHVPLSDLQRVVCSEAFSVDVLQAE